MNHFLAALQRFELRSTGKWFLLSAIIGLVAGLGAIGFHAFGQAVQFTALQQIAGFHPREAAAEGALFEEIPEMKINSLKRNMNQRTIADFSHGCSFL